MKKITRTASMVAALMIAAGTSVSAATAEVAHTAKAGQTTQASLRSGDYIMWLMEDIRKIIAEHLSINVNDIHPEDKITWDLGGDSLDIVEIVMICEKEFDVEISEEDVDQAGGWEAMTVIGLHDAILKNMK